MNTSWRYWWPWIAATIASWTIWATVFAVKEGHPDNGYWPIWVTVPWGVVLLTNAGRGRGRR